MQQQADDADEHLALRRSGQLLCFMISIFLLGRPEIISERFLCFPPIKHEEEALEIPEAPPTAPNRENEPVVGTEGRGGGRPAPAGLRPTWTKRSQTPPPRRPETFEALGRRAAASVCEHGGEDRHPPGSR